MKSLAIASLAVCLSFAPLAASSVPEAVGSDAATAALPGEDFTQPSTGYLMCRIDEWAGASAAYGSCFWEHMWALALCSACGFDLMIPDPIPLADEILLCGACWDQLYDYAEACDLQ